MPSSPSFGNAETPVSSTRPLAIDDTAVPLDLLEELPGGVREVVGQSLHVPAAAGRIGDAPECGFLHQHELSVAGDPAGEGIGPADRPGEGVHGDRVCATEGRGGNRHRRPEHVDPGVALGEHPLGSFGDERNSARHVSRAGSIEHAPDEQARGPELRDNGELVRIGGKGQLDPTGGGTRGVAGRFCRPQVGDEGRERGRQFLSVRCAGRVIEPAVGAEDADIR